MIEILIGLIVIFLLLCFGITTINALLYFDESEIFDIPKIIEIIGIIEYIILGLVLLIGLAYTVGGLIIGG